MLSKTQVIVDCLDSIPTRLMLQDIALLLGKPLVSSAIAGSSGQLTTIFPGDKGLSLIYGGCSQQSEGIENSLGCLAYAATFFSAVECSEVVKILLGKGNVLQNKLLIADLETNDFEIIDLA